MKITVLDGFTLNPGDLSWSGFEKLGELEVFERTPDELVVDRAKDSEAIITNKTKINKCHLDKLPKLKYIGVLATGFNVVDIEAAKEAGIVVTNIPAYSTMSVAQHIFSLILSITNHTELYSIQNHLGKWTNCCDFSYTDHTLIELYGKKLGIIGYGNIGHAVARIARSFGMNVSVFSSKPQDEIPEVTKESMDGIFRTSDIICLCCPLNESTSGMINKDVLLKMKNSAILINTGRGGLVVEKDLAEALNGGQIYAAGVDVLSEEPPLQDNPLLNARNCIITQHIAWATREARERCMDMAVANLEAFQNNEPKNVVTI